MDSQYDIAIVGGRVAGSACAIMLSRLGYRILLIERAEMPSDTLSTHFLLPDGVAALHRLGVLDSVLTTDAPKIPYIQLWRGDQRLIGDLADIDGIDYGLCPRRTVLDGILFDHAASQPGVDAYDRTNLKRLIMDGNRVTGINISDQDGETHDIQTNLVVGADGRNSRVASEVDAEERQVTPAGKYWYYAYFSGATPPEPTANVTSITETDVIITIPTNDGLQMVFYGANHEDFKEFRARYQDNFIERVMDHPAVAQMLSNAELASDVTGMSGVKGYYRTAYGDGWVLAGDAFHQKDPIAARGMSEGLRSAEWLATALSEGINPEMLAHYEELHRKSTWSKYQLMRILARPDWFRTDEQAQIMAERLVSREGLTEFLRLYYDDRQRFDDYFTAEAPAGQ
ncbi:MAG: FAD-dependent oxidoreductase [Chloroflexota bacterium]